MSIDSIDFLFRLLTISKPARKGVRRGRKHSLGLSFSDKDFLGLKDERRYKALL